MSELKPEWIKCFEMRLAGRGFRYEAPPEFLVAEADGIVVHADPTWMMSDDYRACDGVGLTEHGQQLYNEWLDANGYRCKCPPCKLPVTKGYRGQSEYCSSCYESGFQYGFVKGECAFHNRSKREAA